MLCKPAFDTALLPDGKMEYIRFGTGPRHLIMLAGLGESLQRLKGTQVPTALLYRIFARTHTVWMFSRKFPLEPGCTTKTMARDQKLAMERLGIEKADVIGVSMGGMIAQHFAADYPQAVEKLRRSNPDSCVRIELPDYRGRLRMLAHARFPEAAAELCGFWEQKLRMGLE